MFLHSKRNKISESFLKTSRFKLIIRQTHRILNLKTQYTLN